MGWNGDSENYEYWIKAIDKDMIIFFAELINTYSSNALPLNTLNIEEKKIGKKELIYYELNFSHEDGFHEILNVNYLQSYFKELVVVNKFSPFLTVRIEAVITRSSINEYTYNCNEDVIYICSPAQYPKT